MLLFPIMHKHHLKNARVYFSRYICSLSFTNSKVSGDTCPPATPGLLIHHSVITRYVKLEIQGAWIFFNGIRFLTSFIEASQVMRELNI